MKTQLKSMPEEGTPSYSHLEPIVEFLVTQNHSSVTRPLWYQDRDGWRCDLASPLPFDLLRERFEFPSSILLSESHGSILCQNTWIVIRGSGRKKEADPDGQRTTRGM